MAQKKSKKNPRSKETPPAGLVVSERVQLQDVRLLRCTCEQHPEARVDGKKRYNIAHSASVEVDKPNGCICVYPAFRFEAFNEDSEDRAVITVDATFVLTYLLEDFDGIRKSGYQQFADMNGVYNAWPYWREFVQTTIARMGLPALVLPVFRIVEPVKPQRKKRTARRS